MGGKSFHPLSAIWQGMRSLVLLRVLNMIITVIVGVLSFHVPSVIVNVKEYSPMD
jgi:hypothetical protein